MSYQFPASSADYEHWSQHQNMPPGANVPGVMIWVPVLVPVWEYPKTSETQDGESDSQGEPSANSAINAADCQEASGNSDSYSDASTDVGDDDDLDDECEEEVQPGEVEQPNCNVPLQCSRSEELPRRHRLFVKLSREQRVEQLKRVADEFNGLDFDAVDASSQGALVLRMLTILKSLSESTAFHDSQGRHEEKRLSLLGLSEHDEDAMKCSIDPAEKMCEARLYRGAFDTMKEIRPLLQGQARQDCMHSALAETAAAESPSESKRATAAATEGQPTKEMMSSADLEAMKQRRLEKRQRQRQERYEQRGADRALRSAQRYRPPRTTSSSSSSAAPWHPPRHKSGK